MNRFGAVFILKMHHDYTNWKSKGRLRKIHHRRQYLRGSGWKRVRRCASRRRPAMHRSELGDG